MSQKPPLQGREASMFLGSLKIVVQTLMNPLFLFGSAVGGVVPVCRFSGLMDATYRQVET